MPEPNWRLAYRTDWLGRKWLADHGVIYPPDLIATPGPGLVVRVYRSLWTVGPAAAHLVRGEPRKRIHPWTWVLLARYEFGGSPGAAQWGSAVGDKDEHFQSTGSAPTCQAAQREGWSAAQTWIHRYRGTVHDPTPDAYHERMVSRA